MTNLQILVDPEEKNVIIFKNSEKQIKHMNFLSLPGSFALWAEQQGTAAKAQPAEKLLMGWFGLGFFHHTAVRR